MKVISPERNKLKTILDLFSEQQLEFQKLHPLDFPKLRVRKSAGKWRTVDGLCPLQIRYGTHWYFAAAQTDGCSDYEIRAIRKWADTGRWPRI